MFGLPFRQKALEELSSPRELDEAIQVISPLSWLLLITLSFVVIVTLGWIFFGHVQTRLQSKGLVTYEGVRHIDIVSHQEGHITKLLVEQGQQISAGDIVAELESEVLQKNYELALQTVKKLRAELDKLKQERDEDMNDWFSVFQKKRVQIVRRINKGKKDIQRLKKQIQQGDPHTHPEWKDLTQNLKQLEAHLTELDLVNHTKSSSWQQILLRIQQELILQETKATQMGEEIKIFSHVRAPVNGKVVEVLAGVGTFLKPGMGIYRMTNQISDLFTIAFFSSDMAELIRPGMPAQISLNTAGHQELGSLQGVVKGVSPYRLSQEALMALLGNRQLVEQFSQQGAPLVVEVHFIEGPEGGYKWTSHQPPSFRVESGMVAQVSVSVQTQKPIMLLLPALRTIRLSQ